MVLLIHSLLVHLHKSQISVLFCVLFSNTPNYVESVLQTTATCCEMYVQYLNAMLLYHNVMRHLHLTFDKYKRFLHKMLLVIYSYSSDFSLQLG
jgi:hypothetical protein